MKKAALTPVDEHNATLSGVVDFDTVPALYDKLITWLPKALDVTSHYRMSSHVTVLLWR